MKHALQLQAILAADPLRCRALALVHSLALPDCWIGAGFIRNAVWDYLHDRTASDFAGDIDVLWFDPERIAPEIDRRIEAALNTLEPNMVWSVKNQARMHLRNGDQPYSSTSMAIRYWPETATAVAARQSDKSGSLDITAPFGLDDLFSLIVRPTPRFAGAKRQEYIDRIQSKRWLETWPRLRLADAAGATTTL